VDRCDPARDIIPAFLDRVREWLATSGEVLVVVRYLRAAGVKDLVLCRTLEEFQAIVETVPTGADIEVFRTPKLPIRGVATETLVAEILASILPGHEHLIITARSRSGVPFAAEWCWHDEPQELAAWLREHVGEEVAAGPAPELSSPDNDDLTSAAKGGVDGPR